MRCAATVIAAVVIAWQQWWQQWWQQQGWKQWRQIDNPGNNAAIGEVGDFPDKLLNHLKVGWWQYWQPGVKFGSGSWQGWDEKVHSANGNGQVIVIIVVVIISILAVVLALKSQGWPPNCNQIDLLLIEGGQRNDAGQIEATKENVGWWCYPAIAARTKKCTKLMDTTEPISTRHEHLSFAPRYSKGLSLELWIFQMQKGSRAPSKNGNLVTEVDANIDIVTNIRCREEQENKQHCEGRLQLLLLPPMPLDAAIKIDQNIHKFHWYCPSNGILFIIVQ
jgi:hypothetical protein